MRYRIIDACISNKYKLYPTVEELRVKCEEKLYGSEDGERISKSTIEKDLGFMRREYDAPIFFNKHEGGYQYEDESFTLEKIPMDTDELEALRFAAATLNQYRDFSILENFQLALDKIMDKLYVHEETEQQQNVIEFEHFGGNAGSEYLSKLLASINEKRVLELVYFSRNSNAVKSYKIEPYFLKEYRQHWYLLAFNTEKEIVQTFEVGRIQELNALNTLYAKSNFDQEAFFKNAIGITVPKTKPEKVVLEFPEKLYAYISNWKLHKNQELGELVNGFFQVKLNVYLTAELFEKILTLTPSVKIIQPETLKNEILNKLEEGIKNNTP